MTLFLVGIVEMLVVSIWTKVVTDSKVMVSGIVTLINVLIWYYVLEAVLNDLGNWTVVLTYALGCAVGTMLCTSFFQLKEKRKRAKKSTILVDSHAQQVDI